MNAKSRRKARIFAMQALYQWQMSQAALPELKMQYRLSNDYHRYVDWPYFDTLLTGTITKTLALDHIIQDQAALSIADIQPVELALLRLGIFELQYCFEVPYQVVVDEYVSIAKDFAANEAHQFMNAILAKAAKNLRKVEHAQ